MKYNKLHILIDKYVDGSVVKVEKVSSLDFSNLTALVIDDAPIVITSIRIMLRQMGLKDANISHNKDPSAAVYQAKNKFFDIFICDYNFGKSLNGKQIFE